MPLSNDHLITKHCWVLNQGWALTQHLYQRKCWTSFSQRMIYEPLRTKQLLLISTKPQTLLFLTSFKPQTLLFLTSSKPPTLLFLASSKPPTLLFLASSKPPTLLFLTSSKPPTLLFLTSSKVTDVAVPHVVQAIDFAAPHVVQAIDFAAPHVVQAIDFAAPHVVHATDGSAPHDDQATDAIDLYVNETSDATSLLVGHTTDLTSHVDEVDDIHSVENVALLDVRQVQINFHRQQSRKFQMEQTERIVKRSRIELAPGQKGDNVAIPIPLVDRDRGDPRNILAVMLDRSDNNNYTLVTKHGILTGVYSRNEFELCPEKLLLMSDLNCTKHVSLREAVVFGSQCGGQGYIKCNCALQGPKMSDRCKCFKAKLKCNSRCPQSLNCKNK